MIPDPGFPVNFEVLFITIVFFFFNHWSNQLFQSSSQRFEVIQFMEQPVLEKLDMGFPFYGHEMLQVESLNSQVQSYLYKCIRDTYVTFNKSVVEDTSSSTFRLNQWYLK